MSKRLKFFLSHLAISAIIALLVICVVFLLWYPAPLAKAVGVTHIFLMMLAIDVIIGPVLGLLVYKEGKKTLKMDLSIIILLQLSALGYGVYSIEQGRPAWIAYVVDRFELVRKNEIVDENIIKALPQYQHPAWLKPQYVMAQRGKTNEERNNDLFAEALGGISIAQRPERYTDISYAKTQIQQRMQKLDQLKQYNDAKTVADILAKYPQAVGWMPLKAIAVDMTVLLDGQGNVVKIVDLRPWN
ncbi:TfpX/TfpZ family type IV pilin accessory protein [Acinetobacter puyangensis]|uniref:TfpX/TfpZ family type IV pilin accessory protein n=1 Tax=Acinetobacter puyangensis TaxID=1096779 RepID=UPI003A4D374F